MVAEFTVEQVLGMAPDAPSAKSGKELASPRKWGLLGASERAIWGECQGSGANPYQTRIDLREIAFKCSCPSRKFPCKHGLGLLLIFAEKSAPFPHGDEPGWVADWLNGRQEKNEKKAAKKAEDADKPVDPVAQAKRAEQRKDKIASGLTELDRWMQDIIRQGLVSVQNQPYSYWDSMGARLVDAQAPGFARMVRDCAGIPSSGEGWQDRLLERLGKIYLGVEAFSRLNSLPSDLQDEVRTLAGLTVGQDEVLARPAVFDMWQVVGQRIEQEDKLRVQRTWMRGEQTGKWALILAFAHGTAPLDTSLLSGTKFVAELAYFPGAIPLRALIKTRDEQRHAITNFEGTTIAQALNDYAQALAANPWIERYPMMLRQVIPHRYEGEWCVIDEDNALCLVKADKLDGWNLMASSAGKPISIFGEWDGNKLTPLTVAANKTLSRL